jgi:hypothetical protein
MALGDKAFIADANKRLKKKYKTVQDYLTDDGKIEKGSKRYDRRLGRLNTAREKAKTEAENQKGIAERTEIVLSGALMDEARKLYGAVADLYNVPELKPLFEQAFINQWSADELIRQIDNTDWAKSRTNSQETFDIQKTINPVEAENNVTKNITVVRRILTDKGLSISEEQIKSIAEKGTRDGWNGNQWDEYSASEAISFINAGGGKPLEQTVPADVTGQTGTAGGGPSTIVVAAPTTSELRKIAKDFGVTLSDNVLNQFVSDIATNKTTKDQFTEYARSSAQTLYSSIAERLKTSTFDQIVAPYKNIYSQVLEVPEENVDLTDPKMSALFNAGDVKSPRMMTSTEWVSHLRKKPEWQNTSNAYKEYSDLASTLNKIFGGTR